jgi:hypothetical protein
MQRIPSKRLTSEGGRPTLRGAMEVAAADTRLEAVTVYARGARVRRITSLDRTTPNLRITGLPLAVIDDTVRISVEGPALATNVRTGIDTPPEAAAPEESSEVREAKRLATIAAHECGRVRDALERMTTSTILAADPSDEAPASWAAVLTARRAMIAMRSERELALRAELAAANLAKEDADARLEAARDRDRRLGSARDAKPHELRKQIDIELQAIGEGPLAIHIEYLVAAARWAPSYVARIDGSKASLEIRAVVAQASGEDWTGAKLQLSTAEPTRFAPLPELAAQKIGRRQAEPVKSGFRAPPAGADALYADYLRYARTVPGFATAEAPRGNAAPTTTLELDDDGGLGGGEFAPPRGGRAGSIAEQVWDEESSAAKGAFQTPPGGRPIPKPSAAKTMFAAAAMPASAPSDRPHLERKKSAPAANQAFGGAPAPKDDEPPAAPQPRLDYGGLVMADPASSARGSLISAPSDPSRGTAEAAAARARSQIDALALPPGCSAAWSHAYDYTYGTDGAVEIRSDGAWHSIGVTSRAAAVELRHIAVPREQADVFRIATLVNPFAGPLLPAPIDVYDRGRFLVTSGVEYAPPGAKLEIGLGVDAAVKIARNTEFREEAAGMLRGSLRLHHALTIDVENVSGTPIDLEVRERLPVTREGEDDIEVTPGRVEPAWEAWKPDADGPRAQRLRGGYRWRVSVPAGQKKQLRAAYEVKIPSKAELVGGNRRES